MIVIIYISSILVSDNSIIFSKTPYISSTSEYAYKEALTPSNAKYDSKKSMIKTDTK